MEINYNLVNVGLTLSSSAVLSSKNHFKKLAIVRPRPLLVFKYSLCERKYLKWELAVAHPQGRSSSTVSRSNWNLEMLVFEERGKLEYPERNLSEQGREPTTNSTHI